MLKSCLGFLLLSVLMTSAVSSPQRINGQWLDATESPIANPLKTGGQYSFSGDITIDQSGTYVFDFAQGSLYEAFSWQIVDALGSVVASAAGGVGDPTANEFPLRHGRKAMLSEGSYSYLLDFYSTHFIIEPVPYFQEINQYRYAISHGNALTVFCLGIFFALIFYYLFMYFFRRSKADLYYTLFIVGNFLLQGTALLFFKDVFGINWFLLSATPILFSNIAYILFSSELLSLKSNAPKLYTISRWLVAVLSILAVIGILNPHYMMEIDRFGVGVFSLFGMFSGVVLAFRKNKVAYWYLVANITFTILALISIVVTDLGETYHYYTEHIGLLAVATEVLLLALVMSYQVGQLQKNERNSLIQMKRALKISTSDALTGVLNRRAFDRDFEKIAQQDQLYIIDIDGLKIFNDKLGHHRGDELLLRFCELASTHLSLYCSFYRIGGDEFAVIVHSDPNDQVVEAIGRTIVQLNQEGFKNIDASIGSACANEHENLQEVFKLADARMYENKQRNHDNSNISGAVLS